MKRKNIAIIVVAGAVALLLMLIPKSEEYDWRSRTYHHNDAQPYGCLVFDSIMKASCPHGYRHTYHSLSTLQASAGAARSCYLMLGPSVGLLYDALDTMLLMASGGATFMLVSDEFPRDLFDALDISWGWPTDLPADSIPTFPDSLTLRFAACRDSAYRFALPQIYRTLRIDSAPQQPTVLVAADGIGPTCLQMRYGRGSIIVATGPNVMTNYGIVNATSRRYMAQLLGYAASRPIVRTEYYNAYYRNAVLARSDRSTLSVLMAHRGTRRALQLALAGVALFLMLNAVRRQRPIPIVAPPKNQIIRFVRTVASLYLAKNSNADILVKRRQYWAERLLRRTGIDVTHFDRNPEIVNVLADKSGFKPSYVHELLASLFAVTASDSVSDDELATFVADMEKMGIV